MVTRTLSAALIALLLTTPLAAAWCEACIQDRCDMSTMSMVEHGAAPGEQGSTIDDDTMARHHGGSEESSGSAMSSHCAEMSKASPPADPEAAAPSQDPLSAAPSPSCCVDATPDDVQMALAPTTSHPLQLDHLPVDVPQVFANISAPHGFTQVDWTPRPPPRPLFTLHSLLLI